MRSINLGELPNGDLMLISDEAFAHDVKRVEYYKDQKLFMLIYEDSDESDLMHYEISESVAEKVAKKSNLMVVTPDAETGRPMGYYASLIQVGA